MTMAQVPRADHAALEQQLKDVIQDLHNMMVQVAAYDTTSRPSREVLSQGIKTFSSSLQTLHATAASPLSALPHIPPELVQYVENGRNPDIYTREFVELVRRGNQLMRGKQRAFGDFRDVFARELSAAMPELKCDVEYVVGQTGGRKPDGGGDGGMDTTTTTAEEEGGGGETKKDEGGNGNENDEKMDVDDATAAVAAGETGAGTVNANTEKEREKEATEGGQKTESEAKADVNMADGNDGPSTGTGVGTGLGVDRPGYV